MTSFIERLKGVGKGQGRHIGFGRAAVEKEEPLLVVARLDPGHLDLAAEAIQQGASALIVPVDAQGLTQEQADTLAQIERAPWGLALQGGDLPKEAEDADFVVVETAINAANLDTEGPPAIVAVPADIDEALLGSLESVAVEAILVQGIGRPGEPLTLADVMALRRVRDCSALPLVAALDCRLEPGDLPHIRDCQVEALLVNVTDPSTLEYLGELKRTLENLPPAPVRRRPEALLPTLPGRPGAEIEIEPEEPD